MFGSKGSVPGASPCRSTSWDVATPVSLGCGHSGRPALHLRSGSSSWAPTTWVSSTTADALTPLRSLARSSISSSTRSVLVFQLLGSQWPTAASGMPHAGSTLRSESGLRGIRTSPSFDGTTSRHHDLTGLSTMCTRTSRASRCSHRCISIESRRSSPTRSAHGHQARGSQPPPVSSHLIAPKPSAQVSVNTFDHPSRTAR